MTAPQHPDWNEAYLAAEPPPWDIGRPQPEFVRLADRGLLAGRVLDAGCGTGEHALLAAARGADAAGVDLSPRAIEQARAKAAERGLAVRFSVGDALDLGDLGASFDVVIDCGLFHVFDDVDRARYVAGLAAALRPGGTCHLMCFSDRQPGDWGPRRVRQAEIRSAFADGWTVTGIAAARFNVAGGPQTERGAGVAAWLAAIVRT